MRAKFRCSVKLLTSRRALLAGFATGVAAMPLRNVAAAATGFYDIDTPALHVLKPEAAYFEAIAAAGSRFVAVGEHGLIIYSEDNGKSWVQAPTPVDVTLTCVAFATPSLGWAAGHFGVILATIDGGKTWERQLDGVQANQLTLAASQNISGAEANAPGAAMAARRAGLFVDSGPSKPFLALLVFSPMKVIVFGAYRMTMLTTDGGKTWVDWSLHIYDRLSHNLYDAKFIGSNIYVVGEEGLVFCSTDNGETFLPKPSPSGTTIFGIMGTKQNAIFVYGVAGSCFRSTDGGTTWSTSNIASTDSLIAACQLRSGSLLVSTSTGALYASHDDGANFVSIDTIPNLVTGMAETPNTDLIIVGADGVAVTSTSSFN